MASGIKVSNERLEKTLDALVAALGDDFGMDNAAAKDGSCIDKLAFAVDSLPAVLASGREPKDAGVYNVLNSLLATTYAIAQRAGGELAADDVEPIVERLCDTLSKADWSDRFFMWKTKLMTSMFAGFHDLLRLKLYPFCGLLKLSELRPSSRVQSDVRKVRLKPISQRSALHHITSVPERGKYT